MKPLISIITINYNNAAGLEKTIRSVTEQTCGDFEYIVIDGGSTDGSKNIIEQYAPKIRRWVSEPDKGVYNAMNKGITKATGEYLLFLNSGDTLKNNESLAVASRHLGKHDLVYFDLNIQGPAGNNTLKTYPDRLDFRYFIFESLPHPASFIRKNLFDSIGLYNESLKIVSDWAFFMIAVCKKEVNYRHVSKTISVFNLDGISSNPQSQQKIITEKKQVLQAYFPAYESLFDELQQANGLRHTFEHSSVIRFFKLFGFFK